MSNDSAISAEIVVGGACRHAWVPEAHPVPPLPASQRELTARGRGRCWSVGRTWDALGNKRALRCPAKLDRINQLLARERFAQATGRAEIRGGAEEIIVDKAA